MTVTDVDVIFSDYQLLHSEGGSGAGLDKRKGQSLSEEDPSGVLHATW